MGDEGSLSQRLALGGARATITKTDPISEAYRNIGTAEGDNFILGFFDMGFAKLREISATYSLPPGLTRRVGAGRAALTVSGRNLMTLWLAQEYVFGERVWEPEGRFASGLNDNVSELSAVSRAFFPQTAQVATTLRVTF
jgi:hypothetical protein